MRNILPFWFLCTAVWATAVAALVVTPPPVRVVIGTQQCAAASFKYESGTLTLVALVCQADVVFRNGFEP